MGYGQDEDWGYSSVEMNGEVWIQSDGTEVFIEDMTDRHLRNTIRMLWRAGGTHPQMSVLLEEAQNRGWRERYL